MTKVIQIEKTKRGFFGWVFLSLFWGFNAFMAYGLFEGLGATVDEYGKLTSEAEKAGAAIGTTIGVGMILFLWLIGATLLGLMVMMTRGKKIIETMDSN